MPNTRRSTARAEIRRATSMIDADTFAGWIERHHGALYRHALWMTGDAELAADIVQETYHQGWCSRGSLRDPSCAFGWLLTILRRKVFQEYNRAARSRECAEALRASVTDEASDRLVAELIDLARALQTLSPPQRDIVLLYSLHGMSYEEIAEHLQIPIGTVMSRLARARAALNEAQTPAKGAPVIPLEGRRREKMR